MVAIATIIQLVSCSVRMSDFLSRYVKTCEKKSLSPLPCVLESCRNGSPSLDVSTNCLSAGACGVLGRCLRGGHPFVDLNFSDCLVGDEGLCNFLPSLQNDTQVISISLKGNNIRAKGAEELGKVLKRNKTIERLNLEWNNLEQGLRAFSEGIALNTSLKHLDLRSNCISHVGASHIAAALLSNYTLEKLDLRWNSIGILGSRALLSSLKHNNTILHIHLDGNSIPVDILDAFDATLSARATQCSLDAKYHADVEKLSLQLQQISNDSSAQVLDLLEKMDTDRRAFLDITQMSQSQLSDLKGEVQEKDAVIAQFEQRAKEMESALQLSESRSQELMKALAKEQDQSMEVASNLKKEVNSLHEAVLKIEEEKGEEVFSAMVHNKKLEQKVHSLELEKQLVEDRNTLLIQQLDTLRRESESRMSVMEEQLSSQKKHHAKHLQEMETSHQREVQQSVESYESKVTRAQKCQQEAAQQATQLQQEVATLTHKLNADKARAEEEIETLKQTMKLQMKQHQQVQEELREMNEVYQKSKVAVSELQAKNEILQRQTMSLKEEHSLQKHKIEELCKKQEYEQDQQKLENKQHKKERDQLLSEIDRLEKLMKDTKNALEDQQRKNSELQEGHRKQVEDLLKENGELKHSVQKQRSTLQQMKQDELHRTSMLSRALQTYLSSTPNVD